jgi:plastocyanin
MIRHIGPLYQHIRGLAGATALLMVMAPTVAQAADYTVTMANMSFGRIPSALKVGDTITWVNKDTVPHTVTARDKSFDLRMGPGQSAKMTADKEGSFPFYCIFHSTMRGTLKVAAK